MDTVVKMVNGSNLDAAETMDLNRTVFALKGLLEDLEGYRKTLLVMKPLDVNLIQASAMKTALDDVSSLQGHNKHLTTLLKSLSATLRALIPVKSELVVVVAREEGDRPLPERLVELQSTLEKKFWRDNELLESLLRRGSPSPHQVTDCLCLLV